jgi:hypothetical protein
MTRPTSFHMQIAYKRAPHHTTQTLSDVQYKELWERQLQARGVSKGLTHVISTGSGKPIENLLHDIRNLAQLEVPHESVDNIKPPLLPEQEVPLIMQVVLRAHSAADSIDSSTLKAGRDFSDKVARTGGIDNMIRGIRRLCALDPRLRSENRGPLRACLRSILIALNTLVTITEREPAQANPCDVEHRTEAKSLFVLGKGMDMCLGVMQLHAGGFQVEAGSMRVWKLAR